MPHIKRGFKSTTPLFSWKEHSGSKFINISKYPEKDFRDLWATFDFAYFEGFPVCNSTFDKI